MIERISELPLFGPEEQLNKFFDETIQPNEKGEYPNGMTLNGFLQRRIQNLDTIFQKQLIWSYGKAGVDDAYFYWDWCPIGNKEDNNYWQISMCEDPIDLKIRDKNRTFNYKLFKGYRNQEQTNDQMPVDYDASTDEQAKEESKILIDLEKTELLHNMMRSYIEVSEWLGDGATAYGSRNGYVSRKMSFAWLFDSIRGLINWKLNNQDKYAQEDIFTLDSVSHKEKFLESGQLSECQQKNGNGEFDLYTDADDLIGGGRCETQSRVRSSRPWVDGVLKVRGNEFHYGERADFYTHNSFMGECRFFHNARFLGQTTFDKEINGTAMRSRWADLAEYKESDQAYEPGTLVMFGGAKEITLSNGVETHAIVTTKPGLVLNGEKQEGKTMVGIALVGTVPVRIVGSVRKFDKLVPSKKVLGAARARKWYEFWKKPIGIAMNASVDEMVECVTRLEF